MFYCGSNRWRDWDPRWDSTLEDWQRDEPEWVGARTRVTDQDPELRVSQAERDGVAAELAKHYADGRLTLGEYEERVETAFEARTWSDLEPLLADLPTKRSRPGAQRRDRRRSWPAPVVVAVAAVVLLAFAVGPWALWLLWPALVLTGGCRGRSRRVYYRPTATHRPAATRP